MSNEDTVSVLSRKIQHLESVITSLQQQLDKLKFQMEDHTLQEKLEFIDRKVDRLSKAGHY